MGWLATDKQQAKVDMRKAARSTIGRPVVCNILDPRRHKIVVQKQIKD
jgi:hypothetical protein